MFKKELKNRSIIAVALLIVVAGSSLLSITTASAIYIPPTTHTFIVKGYVRNTAGQPLAGALVKLTYGTPETGIYKTDYTDSNGYYYISVSTTLYVNCKMTTSRTDYYTQTRYVYSSGTNSIDVALQGLPPVYYCKAGSVDPFSLYGNMISITMTMYSSYAIANIAVRYSSGSGYIVLTDHYYNGWELQLCSTRVRHQDGSTSSLQADLYSTTNGGLYYDTDGLNFIGDLVELDFRFKVYYGYQNSGNQIKMQVATTCRTNRNNIVGFQSERVWGNADCDIVYDETQNWLQSYYAAMWDGYAADHFDDFINDWAGIGCELTSAIFGYFVDIDNKPTPYFLFHKP